MAEATLTRRPSDHDRLMDRTYRYQRHFYNLTRKYYLLGRDRLIADLAPKPDDTVLEVGTGTARNLIEAARRYPNARYFGVDISDEMLKTARSSIVRHGLEARIRLEKADATNFDGAALFGQPRFDRVILSYSLSMIPSWTATLERALQALAPGGRLMIVDFGELAAWPNVCRRMLFAWLKRFHVTPRLDLVPVIQDLIGSDGFEMTSTQAYGGYAQMITVTRLERS